MEHYQDNEDHENRGVFTVEMARDSRRIGVLGLLSGGDNGIVCVVVEHQDKKWYLLCNQVTSALDVETLVSSELALCYNEREWKAFLDGIRAGEFDPL